MKIRMPASLIHVNVAGLVLATVFCGGLATRLAAKEKVVPISPDDPTYRLFQLLDNAYGGKLEGFCVIANLFKDPENPDHEEQYILKVEYDKNRAFGKLRIYARTVDKLTPDQLKTYTPKDIFSFAEADSLKFTKTDPGALGKVGDVYFRAQGGGPLAAAPVSEEARKQYDFFVTQYIIPALEKKQG
jgi:hypothetical protein